MKALKLKMLSLISLSKRSQYIPSDCIFETRMHIKGLKYHFDFCIGHSNVLNSETIGEPSYYGQMWSTSFCLRHILCIKWIPGSFCNIGFPTETHLKLKSRQYHCRALCRISKRLVNSEIPYGRTRFYETWVSEGILYWNCSMVPIPYKDAFLSV